MPRPAASLLAILLGATAAIALASCGEEDAQLLPGGTAREITANLDTVQLLADEGDCVGAESAAQQVSEQVDALGGVDPRLKQALREGAARLNEVVTECEEGEEEAFEVVPPPTEEEPGEDERKLEKEEEKLQKQEEKERDREAQEGEENDGGDDEGSSALPPQANGEGKGLENGDGEGPGDEGEGSPSGGLGPGSPVEEGD